MEKRVHPRRQGGNRGSKVLWARPEAGNERNPRHPISTPIASPGDAGNQAPVPDASLDGPPTSEAGAAFGAGTPIWPGPHGPDQETVEPSPDYLRGELARANAYLMERDTEIRALNKEISSVERHLGNLEMSVRPAERGLLARLGKLFGGIAGRWRKGAQATNGTKETDPIPERFRHRDPLVPFAQETGMKRIVAFTVFGLTREKLSKVLDTVENYCRKRDTMPVILTDSDCFELFRERNMAFEYLPPPEARERFGPELQWSLYFQRRLTLFRSKWRPAGIVSFGTRAPIENLDDMLASDANEPSEG